MINNWTQCSGNCIYRGVLFQCEAASLLARWKYVHFLTAVSYIEMFWLLSATVTSQVVSWNL